MSIDCRAPTPPAHPGLYGSRPAASPHRPWLPPGSCPAHGPDRLRQRSWSNIAPDRIVALPMTISRPLVQSLSSRATSNGAKLCASASDPRGWTTISPDRIALRLQANTCCELTPCVRATAETFAPRASASSKIRAFASADQRGQQGRALLKSVRNRLDDCKCFKSGLGCRLQSNLPRESSRECRRLHRSAKHGVELALTPLPSI